MVRDGEDGMLTKATSSASNAQLSRSDISPVLVSPTRSLIPPIRRLPLRYNPLNTGALNINSRADLARIKAFGTAAIVQSATKTGPSATTTTTAIF